MFPDLELILHSVIPRRADPQGEVVRAAGGGHFFFRRGELGELDAFDRGAVFLGGGGAAEDGREDDHGGRGQQGLALLAFEVGDDKLSLIIITRQKAE